MKQTSSEMMAGVSVNRRWGVWERFTTELAVGFLAWAAVALATSLIGSMHWWLVLPGSVAVWALLRRMLPESLRSRDGAMDKWWIAALVLTFVVTIFNCFYPAEHLLTGRDSGTYVATAGWLAETGSLYVDAEVDAFEGFPELDFATPGFYQREGEETLEPQFMHAFPTMLASLIDVGGIDIALRLNAVVGGVLLLAMFGLGRRLMRPPAALVSLGALAGSLVFIYYARAPFTELLMAWFAVTGVWLLMIADEMDHPRLGLLAGTLIGAATMVRLDGIVLLVPVTAYLVVRAATRTDLIGTLRAVRTGMFVTALVGLGESLWVSPAYVLERSGQVTPVLVAVLLLLLVSDVGARYAQRLISFYREHRDSVFKVVVAVSAVFMLYAWLVRPVFVEVSGGGYGLAAIQEREDLEIDSSRSYAEQSVRWIVWYQGPFFVILGFVGTALLLRRAMVESGRRTDGLVVLVLASFAALYFWRPSINPDHIWAMRRYLTVVLPFAAITAAYAVDRITASVSPRLGMARNLVGVSLAGILLVPPILTTAPSWDIAELGGLSGDFEAACQEVGQETHLLIVGESLGTALAQGFRSYCGIPTAYTDDALTQSRLLQLESSVDAAGSRLVVVGEASGRSLFPGSYEFLLQTLSKPPKERANLTPEVIVVG